MDLFGKNAAREAARLRDEALRKIEDLEAEIARLQAELDEERRARRGIEARARELEAERDAARAEAARAEEAKDKAERMADWLESKRDELAAGLDGALKEKASLEARVSGLEAELEALRRKADEPERPAAPSPSKEPGELDRLRSENERLRRRAAELNERLKVASRKAEHNRRAYLVTQMQLDLAEDRIHILTKGKPRPVLGKGRAAPEQPEGGIQAVDVEEYQADGSKGSEERETR